MDPFTVPRAPLFRVKQSESASLNVALREPCSSRFPSVIQHRRAERRSAMATAMRREYTAEAVRR